MDLLLEMVPLCYLMILKSNIELAVDYKSQYLQDWLDE